MLNYQGVSTLAAALPRQLTSGRIAQQYPLVFAVVHAAAFPGSKLPKLQTQNYAT
jgi:hypothetical protein